MDQIYLRLATASVISHTERFNLWLVRRPTRESFRGARSQPWGHWKLYTNFFVQKEARNYPTKLYRELKARQIYYAHGTEAE